MTDIRNEDVLIANTQRHLPDDTTLHAGIGSMGEIYVYEGEKVIEKHQVPLDRIQDERRRLGELHRGNPNVSIFASSTGPVNSEEQKRD